MRFECGKEVSIMVKIINFIFCFIDEEIPAEKIISMKMCRNCNQ